MMKRKLRSVAIAVALGIAALFTPFLTSPASAEYCAGGEVWDVVGDVDGGEFIICTDGKGLWIEWLEL